MPLQDKMAINVMNEIIRLNDFDNKMTELFGYSNENSVLEFSATNLFEVFLFLSKLEEYPTQVMAELFYGKNEIDNCEQLYHKLLKLKEENN